MKSELNIFFKSQSYEPKRSSYIEIFRSNKRLIENKQVKLKKSSSIWFCIFNRNIFYLKLLSKWKKLEAKFFSEYSLQQTLQIFWTQKISDRKHPHGYEIFLHFCHKKCVWSAGWIINNYHLIILIDFGFSLVWYYPGSKNLALHTLNFILTS